MPWNDSKHDELSMISAWGTYPESAEWEGPYRGAENTRTWQPSNSME